jgi:predicted MPP superfamily phosphohydrolase
MKKIKKLILLTATILLSTLIYNEYLIYWQTLLKCQWPKSAPENPPELINMMLLSDTHLLGSRHGHWFDKLRREWQMSQAFQTARILLKPDYIVIMGDITDEGKWCSDKEVLSFFRFILTLVIFNARV